MQSETSFGKRGRAWTAPTSVPPTDAELGPVAAEVVRRRVRAHANQILWNPFLDIGNSAIAREVARAGGAALTVSALRTIIDMVEMALGERHLSEAVAAVVLFAHTLVLALAAFLIWRASSKPAIWTSACILAWTLLDLVFAFSLGNLLLQLYAVVIAMSSLRGAIAMRRLPPAPELPPAPKLQPLKPIPPMKAPPVKAPQPKPAPPTPAPPPPIVSNAARDEDWTETLARRVLSIEGRGARADMWLTGALPIIVLIVALNLLYGLPNVVPRNVAIVCALGALAFAYITAAARRFHDRGMSAWWAPGGIVAIYALMHLAAFIEVQLRPLPDPAQLVRLVRGISAIALAIVPTVYLACVLLFVPGDRGPNRYGPDPLAR